MNNVEKSEIVDTEKLRKCLSDTIYSQNQALSLIEQKLQIDSLKLDVTQQITTFLFVGPPGVGKRTTALALSNFLNESQSCLTTVEFNSKICSLDFLISRLNNILNKCSNPVILFQNIDKADSIVLDFIDEMITYGFCCDREISQAIFILTVDLEKNLVTKMTDNNATQKRSQLLQLVLDDLPGAENIRNKHHQQKETASLQDIEFTMSQYLNQKILDKSSIIPFSCINYSGLLNIIKRYIKNLANQLNKYQKLQLEYTDGFASELLQALPPEMHTPRGIQLLFKHQIYNNVAKAIFNDSDIKRLKISLGNNGNIVCKTFND